MSGYDHPDFHEEPSAEEPNAVDAERSFLGAMMVQNGYDDYLGLLDEKRIARLDSADFYDARHRAIWSGIGICAQDGYVDPMTVAHALRGKKDEKGGSLLPLAGGPEYLAALADIGGAPINIPAYGKIIKETAQQREILALTQVIHTEAWRGSGGPLEIIGGAENKIFELGEKIRGVRKKTTMGGVVEGMMTRLTRAVNNDDYSELDGAATGLTPLDNLLNGGFRPGELTIIAARPGMGKTAFALDISARLLEQGKAVAFFSLEMSEVQLGARLMARQSRVNSTKIIRGRMGGKKLDHNDLTALAEGVATIKSWKLELGFDEIKDWSDMQAAIRGSIRRNASAGHPLELIVVDYLQLVETDDGKGRRDLRAVEVAKVSRGLKMFAREFGIPVLALAQLNRNVEDRAIPKPQLSDLRESGAIEQDADIVIFMYLPVKDENGELARAPVMEVSLYGAKCRQGVSGGVEQVKFRKSISKFAPVLSEVSQQQ